MTQQGEGTDRLPAAQSLPCLTLRASVPWCLRAFPPIPLPYETRDADTLPKSRSIARQRPGPFRLRTSSTETLSFRPSFSQKIGDVGASRRARPAPTIAFLASVSNRWSERDGELDVRDGFRRRSKLGHSGGALIELAQLNPSG